MLEVTVEVVEHLGGESHLLFALDDVRSLDDEAPSLCTAVVDAGTTARPGDVVRLALDPAALHLFDPKTGASLRR